MKRIILKPGEERRILSGHPWVYGSGIACVLSGAGKEPRAADADAALEPGEPVDVESSRKEYLGRAFANPNSKITARIYSPSKEGADKGFFKRRVREAVLRRLAPGPGGVPAYDLRREPARLVFAEADFLPGLIIDRFVGWPLDAAGAASAERPLRFEDTLAALGPPGSWLSVQFLSWGMDARREMILDAVEEVLSAPLLPGMEAPGPPLGIMEKSGAKVRELEGLPLREGLARGSFPPGGIVIFENGLPFAVHLEEGQKTGYFLDQRENHRMAADLLKARLAGAGDLTGEAPGENSPSVLDLCAYSGGFGIHAARAGAESVTCVDVSAPALETVRKNAALNGVSGRIKTVEADVFEYLRAAGRKKERYDLIILDPPAFAKTRASLDSAVRGYKEINLRAVPLLKSGGFLVTCSCSQALDEIRFKRVVCEAAGDAGRRLIQTGFRYQAPDHPILVGYDESFYLKCGIYQVLR